MISPIKIALIIPLLLLIGLLVVQLRNRTTYRFVLILIALTGISFIIYPDFATVIAHRMHVGRGTDLLFYFCALAGFIAMIILYSKMRAIAQVQTRIIQIMAVDSAMKTTNDNQVSK